MEEESFEDDEVAQILNEFFVAIKVDKEERPDIDSIYMNVCQAVTGSGGWPLTTIMTAEQKPFFSATYLPKHSRYGSIGLVDLLNNVKEMWANKRAELIKSGDEITDVFKGQTHERKNDFTGDIIEEAVTSFKGAFDKTYGGFGRAPKFPSPHNLLFLLRYYEVSNDTDSLQMVETTLRQMYRGGIFDHIGFGFSRYSTDQKWLAPHFEKMLYDNALLTLVYLEAYKLTGNELYKTVAGKTLSYVLRELTSGEGAFYCAQDADSEGVEGKYYVFSPDETLAVLGEDDGARFNHYYNITATGNFEGKSIPNLIGQVKIDNELENLCAKVYEYRKTRTTLHKDDKILTSWNALMIIAFVKAYEVLGEKSYLDAAMKANTFIENNLADNDKLFASYREGKRSERGFLDDYAFYILAQVEFYRATLDKGYLDKALLYNGNVMRNFYDEQNGGFYLYGQDSEQLIFKPKETYDGAIPSGNSVMAYNLILLSYFKADLAEISVKQLEFLDAQASSYPTGYSFYLLSLLLSRVPLKEITCVLKNKNDLETLKAKFPKDAIVRIFEQETKEFPLINDKTTFYICENNRCNAPTNEL